MIKTGFRPSDDAHKLPFNIPGNAYVVAALRESAVVLTALGEATASGEAVTLAAQVEAGIQAHGVIHHPAANGTVYAYEVDGYGSYYFMDDANLPSLLALPVYGWTNVSDPVYQRTRALVLSQSNPWFFSGSAGAGVGGPHDGLFRVWPMSYISMAHTTANDTELASLLTTLVASTGCTGLMHESIDMNDAGSYTRSWFAWANSYFAGLILDIAETKPELIFNQ
jgi:meiotically up-regulated gene 157 (Mug157) protein